MMGVGVNLMTNTGISTQSLWEVLLTLTAAAAAAKSFQLCPVRLCVTP